MKLDNKTAIITGGASGIGLESAKLFISEGANVIIADLNESEGRPAAEALGSRCRFVKTDVSDKSSAYFCVMEALKRFGSLEILVNNAGITSDASLHKMSSEQFEKVIDVNLKGVFFMTKYAAA
ncbi:MAG TPA: 3-oxoacyl-ACP reductase, partial [Bacteroidetes bacterium]|nr:3-oxoacyl-ACP reductase [Bacteroidota bacterium]